MSGVTTMGQTIAFKLLRELERDGYNVILRSTQPRDPDEFRDYALEVGISDGASVNELVDTARRADCDVEAMGSTSNGAWFTFVPNGRT